MHKLKETGIMKPRKIGQFLVADPRVCHGKLTFKGTRVPVETVLTFLAKGESIPQILAGWPELSREAVEEAIRLAAAALVQQNTRPVRTAHAPSHSGRST